MCKMILRAEDLPCQHSPEKQSEFCHKNKNLDQMPQLVLHQVWQKERLSSLTVTRETDSE